MDKEYPNEVQMSFMGHLRELHTRAFKTILVVLCFFLIGFTFSEEFYHFLMSSVPEYVIEKADGLFDGFMLKVKLALYFAVFCSLPVITYQGYKFIRPALKIKEDSTVKIYLALGFFLLCGALFFAHSVLPFMVEVLLSFQPEDITTQADILSYSTTIMTIYLGFAIIFQVPLVVFLTIMQGFVEADFYRSHRKIVVVLLMVLCAIFSPPDLASLLILFCPLYALFEGAVLLGSIMKGKDVRA
ncbi:MAG: twin-arginine translocase subunit TatC [Planctomycetes bacterium]|nr:twin-arginine translocase subunit TatC [Planctomycetota bacterium]